MTCSITDPQKYKSSDSGLDSSDFDSYVFTGKQWDARPSASYNPTDAGFAYTPCCRFAYEDAKLYYFNARWYDPETGRFITEDPIKDGLLWYCYVNNNPMGFVDPTGMEPAAILGTVWGIALAEPTPVGEIVAGIVTAGVGLHIFTDGKSTDAAIISNPILLVLAVNVLVAKAIIDSTNEPMVTPSYQGDDAGVTTTPGELQDSVPNIIPGDDFTDTGTPGFEGSQDGVGIETFPAEVNNGPQVLTAQKKIPERANSQVWSNLKNYRSGIRTDGKGRKKQYYEWDNTHNDIEVYNRNGDHQGSMDPTTGEMYKDAVEGRKLDLD